MSSFLKITFLENSVSRNANQLLVTNVIASCNGVAESGGDGIEGKLFSERVVICPPPEDDEEDDGGGGSRRRRSVLDSLREGRFGLHLDGSLLALWRFFTKQMKQRVSLTSTGRHWENKDAVVAAESGVEEDGSGEAGGTTAAMETTNNVAAYWTEAFYDPSLPLVIDLGCRMGVSLLGLSLPTNEENT